MGVSATRQTEPSAVLWPLDAGVRLYLPARFRRRELAGPEPPCAYSGESCDGLGDFLDNEQEQELYALVSLAFLSPCISTELTGISTEYGVRSTLVGRPNYLHTYLPWSTLRLPGSGSDAHPTGIKAHAHRHSNFG